MGYDLSQLAAFTATVAAGSLGRAAMALHITQPALSRVIQRLEASVGAPLFERHARGMQLTDIGRALLPHAQLLQREAQVAREEIDAMRGVARGTIRVGAIASISGLVLAGLLARVLERWPGLRVQVVEDVWNNLAEALVRHDVDLVLGVEVADTDDVISIKDCRWQDTMSIVAAKSHPLRRRRRLVLADTLQQPWAFVPQGTEPHQHLQRVFAANGLGVPELVVETRSVVVLKSLVVHAGFLSWLPEPMYGAERKAGLIHPLRIPGSTDTRTLTAFRRRAGLMPGPALKLLEELRRSLPMQPIPSPPG
jgi:DNA-binding transcriptional LysR family regulator